MMSVIEKKIISHRLHRCTVELVQWRFLPSNDDGNGGVGYPSDGSYNINTYIKLYEGHRDFGKCKAYADAPYSFNYGATYYNAEYNERGDMVCQTIGDDYNHAWDDGTNKLARAEANMQVLIKEVEDAEDNVS